MVGEFSAIAHAMVEERLTKDTNVKSILDRLSASPILDSIVADPPVDLVKLPFKIQARQVKYCSRRGDDEEYPCEVAYRTEPARTIYRYLPK